VCYVDIYKILPTTHVISELLRGSEHDFNQLISANTLPGKNM